MKKYKGLQIASKILMLVEGLSMLCIVVLLGNFENLGKIIVYLPWMFLIILIIGIIGIVISFKLQTTGADETIQNTGTLDLNRQIFFKTSKQLIFFSVVSIIFGSIGFFFLTFVFHFASF